MKYSKEVEVSAEEFFKYLINGISQEFSINFNNLEDMNYNRIYQKDYRQGSAGVSIKYQVLSVIQNEYILSKYETKNGSTTVSYHLQPISNSRCIVTLDQTTEYKHKTNKLISKMRSFLSNSQTQFDKQIDTIVNSIVTERK